MFGYKLKLVKSRDIIDKEMFEKIVIALNTEINDFIRSLSSPFELNEDFLNQLTTDIDGLHSFIDIYYNNKYSTPSNVLLLMTEMKNLRNYASRLIDIASDADKLNEFVPEIQARFNIGDDGIEAVKQEFTQAVDILNKRIWNVLKMMVRSLRFMRCTIETDVLMVTMGVDVSLLYKDRMRRLRYDKDLRDDITVSFKMTSKINKNHLDKEEYKKESQKCDERRKS